VNGRLFSGVRGNAFPRNQEDAVHTAPAPNRSERPATSASRATRIAQIAKGGEMRPLWADCQIESRPHSRPDSCCGATLNLARALYLVLSAIGLPHLSESSCSNV
jgi:hypothetical protein